MYSYDRTAAVPFAVKKAGKVKSQAAKVLHAYGKASTELYTLQKEVQALQPSFASLGNPTDIAADITNLIARLREAVSTSKDMNYATDQMFDQAKDLVEKIKSTR